MLCTVVALALLTAAPGAAEGAPAVTVLPLSAAKGVPAKQARGVDALLRERLVASDFLKLLPRQRSDAREGFRCGVDPGCLTRLAYARGADLLATGVVSETEEGFEVRLVVVEPSSKAALRDVTERVIGTREDMGYWLDRLVRRAFKPEALAGGLYVVGEPAGANVLVDGALAGTLPFAEALEGVVEGEHEITVEQPGYVSVTRRADVRFREVTRVEVVLRAERPTAALPVASDDGEVRAGVLGGPWIPASVAGAAAVGLAGGALFGTLALLDQLEAERRAEAQLLILPRDADLLTRGETFAFTANLLYVLSAVGLVSAGGLFVADLVTTPAPEELESFHAPAAGAPESDEMRPRLLD